VVVTNWDTDAARRYHERTKHTFRSVRAGGHYLDWENRPHPFKEYVHLDGVPIPREGSIGRLLRWGAGVVRSRELPGGDVYHFRTYSSAGALYPVEVYLACPDLPGVSAGVHHVHPLEHALRRVRAGDVRAELAEAADAESLAEAEAVLVLTGILWRTAWKYQARGYRHLYWDAGTMLANLLALAARGGTDARVVTGFVDEEVNRVVGVDGRSEGALALLAVGRARRAPQPPPLEPLDLDVAPLSRRSREYPDAEALHAASVLQGRDDVRRYRGNWTDGSQNVDPVPPEADLEDVIRRRGSVRNFARATVPAAELTHVLSRAAAPVPADVPPSCETYLIANAVDGISRGAYRFEAPERFELLRSGDFRREAAYLCLEQPLGGLAAATHFLLADLERALDAHGNRGYRAAQLEAGIRAGRIYLGAVARGLAATASTFYDDDVTRFFGANDREAMLAVAVGRSP
jgi:SagB-type dehydrogenase family enzyme